MSKQPREVVVASGVDVVGSFPQSESGQELLERILENRRAKWERHELDRIQAQGKQPRGDEWKKKYKEPAAIDGIPITPIPEVLGLGLSRNDLRVSERWHP